jgi:hypothetical protein
VGAAFAGLMEVTVVRVVMINAATSTMVVASFNLKGPAFLQYAGALDSHGLRSAGLEALA